MPALQKAAAVPAMAGGIEFASASLPSQRRETRIEKDLSAEEIAREVVAWIRG